jgi:hypothetical protein
MRSATVVSVTNQRNLINRVFVTFFKGFTDDSSPSARWPSRSRRNSQSTSPRGPCPAS